MDSLKHDFKNNYATKIGRMLRPARTKTHSALDLYAGAGGFSLGLEAAGFDVIGIEHDIDCCSTYNLNLNGECVNASITPSYDFPNVDLIVGGPPCQPFSVHGSQLGYKDSRNGIPSFISAVKKIRPKMWMLENVRGILYRNRSCFESSVHQLRKLGYCVDVYLINCANYGVPQKRERVIAVGHDGSYVEPKTMNFTVTAGDALLHIDRCDIEKPSYLTPNMDAYIAVYEQASRCSPRDLDMKKPARTLTCRNLAGHSSDMHRIRMRNGKRRTLYIREAARLQGFPDWFIFQGGRNSVLRQIGNAIPPPVALAFGIEAITCLRHESGRAPHASKHGSSQFSVIR